jgi:hypothetical protein
MNDTGPHLGKSKQNQEISEHKILDGSNVLHVQTVQIIISMYISKPLRFYFIYKNCQPPLHPAESIGRPQNKTVKKKTKICDKKLLNKRDKFKMATITT